MKLNDILNNLFGNNPPPKQPPAPAAQPKPTVGFTVPPDCAMQVSKVVKQFDLVARSYNLPIWAPQSAADHLHDWGVMLAHGDLQSASLQLLAADKSILYELSIRFEGQKPKLGLVDSANGVELPVLDRAAVVGHRLMIQQNGREAVYRHLLRMTWRPAEALRKRPGDTFASEHARKITGGRQTANVHVGAEARQRLVVTQTGEAGYAFGEVPAKGWKGIFLHRKFAPPGFQFRIGQQLLAVCVQTPRGLQARAIQPV
jgi:hypothetical protein